MDMLRKLLDMVNFKWSKSAEIQQPLLIGQGTGTNPYLTLREGILYFHKYQSAPDMTPNQQIILDGLTLTDLKTQVTSMGYTVDSSEGDNLTMMGESALILLDADSQYVTSGATLFAFRSNFHRVLYPIHRVLTTYNGDIDKAIEQLLLPSTSGSWLDYWCSFFNIKRLPNEDDSLLLKRTFLNLTSAKSNNTAMEELISYYVGTNTTVTDYAPSEIMVGIDASYIGASTATTQQITDIVETLRSAAVEYFFAYTKTFDDSYQASFLNRYGKTFRDYNAVTGVKGTVQFPAYTDNYRLLGSGGVSTFFLNSGTLNTSSSRLSSPSDKVLDILSSMVMTDSSGNVVQQL